MSEKLPNLWVHHQEELSANAIRQGIPENYSLSVPSKNNHLYLPAEKIREITERFKRRIEFCWCDDDFETILADLEALIDEVKA